MYPYPGERKTAGDHLAARAVASPPMRRWEPVAVERVELSAGITDRRIGMTTPAAPPLRGRFLFRSGQADRIVFSRLSGFRQTTCHGC